jgi:bacteriocin biosynthesis cyclodehydratase domain-containing protein
VWRTANTLQLGLDPARAMLLDLPDPRAARMLDLLDGSRSERLALSQAASVGLRPDEARTLLDMLHAAGLVVPAQSLFPPAMPERLTSEAGALAFAAPLPAHTPTVPAHPPTPRTPASPAGMPSSPARTLRRRASARVVVTGRGRLAAGVAVALAEAGVGHVHPGLPGQVGRHEPTGGPLTAADTGGPRAEAVAEAIQRAAPGTETRTVRRGAASLLIHFGQDQPAALLAISHAQRRQPHLTAAIREGRVLVGPLVLPATAPCLNCIALHRRDRDPDLPEAAAAQSGPTNGPLEPCAVATLLAATGYITGEALAYLDGNAPETLGAEVEISTPGRFRRRTWLPHPGCDCTRRVRR